MAGRQTPVMQQHAAAKQACPDAIVFFRLGDFYEMFGDDAVRAARLLDLTLTSRNKGKPDEVPMCGVPHHAAHGYIARLLEQGEKVAICEQMADPAKCKGIVPREVVRVITPGTVTELDHLDSSNNNWLCALELRTRGVGVALLDVSTGELRAALTADLTLALAELGRAAPREVLLGHEGATLDLVDDAVSALRAVLPQSALRVDAELDDAGLTSALGTHAAECAVLDPTATHAVGRVLRYARSCYPGKELAIRQLGVWDPSRVLRIDRATQSHLELVESGGGRRSSLLGVIDRTRTAAGARLLRQRLLGPLTEVEGIRRRLDQVETFVTNGRLRGDVRRALGDMTDLERLVMRATLGEATPRDLGALRDGLLAGAAVMTLLEELRDEACRAALELDRPIDLVADLAAGLAEALTARPPAQAKDGAIFARGFDAELDELDELRRSGTERIVAYETDLRARTAIASLKVKFTRVFGWYIEVSRSQQAKAPRDWRRKQTVAGGERYTTDALEELAERIASAEERYRERELEMLRQLVRRTAGEAERIRSLAARLAEIDVAAALADVATDYDYRRPEVDDSTRLEIRDGRHPVVERLAAAGRFVPNDLSQDVTGERLWLITGPNMAGKSTFLRQSALIVILAQMGSYVPARYARIGLVDRVLSRVGASDNLAAGESTFMVEMRETAQILRHATERSFVILDEIGRGTSTFDGLAIAWAVAEYLDEVIGCRALFATHYHELTELGEASAHSRNYSVSARELDEDVVFLHRLVPGAASRSYGVAVAKLAGLPEAVVARARALLSSFEGDKGAAPLRRKGGGKPSPQLGLFQARAESTAERDVLEVLRHANVDRLTGLEALQLVHQLQNKLKS
jgi:DNA mismatch repair protein MutS